MGVAVEVWWSSLDAAEHGLLDGLDDVERARVRALERPADQGRSLLGAALLRVAAGERLGVPPADVVVDRTCADCGRPHGRPRVGAPGGPGPGVGPGVEPGVGPGDAAPHVSVSHSGLLVVVALCDAVPVGVDVQRVADLGSGRDAERDAARWARTEAARKAGAGPVPPVLRDLAAPLGGYVAALATLHDRAPATADLVVRRWPGGPRP